MRDDSLRLGCCVEELEEKDREKMGAHRKAMEQKTKTTKRRMSEQQEIVSKRRTYEKVERSQIIKQEARSDEFRWH